MGYRLLYVGLFFAGLLLAPAVHAQSYWRSVEKYLQPNVNVVEKSKDRLVVEHPVLQDTLIFAYTGPEDCACDVYSTSKRRRGGNPYRVWVATMRFWEHPERPQNQWGQFFRARFLQIIRPPLPSDT